jgi:hypothetical protein
VGWGEFSCFILPQSHWPLAWCCVVALYVTIKCDVGEERERESKYLPPLYHTVLAEQCVMEYNIWDHSS